MRIIGWFISWESQLKLVTFLWRMSKRSCHLDGPFTRALAPAIMRSFGPWGATIRIIQTWTWSPCPNSAEERGNEYPLRSFWKDRARHWGQHRAWPSDSRRLSGSRRRYRSRRPVVYGRNRGDD